MKHILFKMLRLFGSQWEQRAFLVAVLTSAFLSAKVTRKFTAEREESFVRKFIKPGDVCLDVGAYVGQYSHLFSRLVGRHGSVHSIEPVPGAFAVLSRVVRAFHLSNVSVYNIAFAESTGSRDIVVPTGTSRTARSHFRATRNDENGLILPIPALTMDEFTISVGLPRLDFMKCDVEGAELLVLRGGQNTLMTFRPVIMCEVEERWMRYDYAAADIFGFLHGLNYVSFFFNRHSLIPTQEVSKGRNNYIFVPQEKMSNVLSLFA